VTEPTYVPCERCQRLRLNCKIESNFKRVGKRSKNAEMEREIVDLRRQLASQQSSPTTTAAPLIKPSSSASTSPTLSNLPQHLPPHMDQFMGSEEAIAGLMDMRYGSEGGPYRRSPNGQPGPSRQIGNVALTHDQVQDLFQQYVSMLCYRLDILDNVCQLLHLLPSLPSVARPRKVSGLLL